MTKWISIKERLPEKEGTYMVFGTYNEDGILRKSFDFTEWERTWIDIIPESDDEMHRKRTDECKFYCFLDVTHWTTLPDEPEEIPLPAPVN
jgi:hypothetical protein